MAHRTTTHQAYDPRQVQEHIVETPLNEEMSKSFLEYAYSVIYARALPDARDGLKPVQRRIIYQMGEMNLTPDRPYMKSARVVGEVMGKLPPPAIQPSTRRWCVSRSRSRCVSRWWTAMAISARWTTACASPIHRGPSGRRGALGMNADIDEDTVDFTPNYDNKLKADRAAVRSPACWSTAVRASLSAPTLKLWRPTISAGSSR